MNKILTMNDTRQQIFGQIVFMYDAFLCFLGADFKNDIKNFVMSIILPLFKILQNFDFKFV